MRILVLDDMKKHRVAAVEQLRVDEHEVVAVSSYEQAVNLAVNGEKPFDVALVDLLMPAETMTLGVEGMKFLGQPIDVGFSLSMKLAIHGVKRIAVVTDMNHHHHPASAIMDWFLGHELDICGCKVRFMQAWILENGAKDWRKALEEISK